MDKNPPKNKNEVMPTASHSPLDDPFGYGVDFQMHTYLSCALSQGPLYICLFYASMHEGYVCTYLVYIYSLGAKPLVLS